MRWIAIAAALVMSAPLAQAQTSAVDATPIAAASAQHRIRAAGANIRYSVAWEEFILRNAAGEDQATISATSYLRQGVRQSSQRPVVFAFNGGPGASSSPLHFGLLGPRAIVTGAGGARSLADNPDTILDVADLVLIDPVGTGFGRVIREGGGQAYWGVQGDPDAAVQLIRGWLMRHERAASPIYIIGESYGGFRAAQVAAALGDLNLAGLVLVSPALEYGARTSDDQGRIAEFPSMAATAFAHGRVATEGRSVEQIYEEARAFAQDDLAAALQLGNALPVTERDRLAQRMSDLIAIPAATIASANLRLDSQDFLERLLPGQVVGRVDTRVAAPAPGGALVPGRVRQADDPALGLGRSNVIVNAAAGSYLRDEVGVASGRDYVSLTLDVNFAWDWRPPEATLSGQASFLSAAPKLADYMRNHPQGRILLLSGYYDLATPLLAQTYVIDHADLPRDRVMRRAFASGHTPFEGVRRPEVARVLRAFIIG